MASSDRHLYEDSIILFRCPEISQYIPTESQHLLDSDTDLAGFFWSATELPKTANITKQTWE